MPISLVVLLTAAVTIVLTIVVRQLMGPERKIRYEVERHYRVHDPAFLRSMGGLLPPPIIGGNAITPLMNGREIFPAMLDAIRSARQSIAFETYIYWSGRIAREFADALAERARAGVHVHVLLDWFGSAKIDADALRTMTDAGVQIERYHPVRWYDFRKFNNRTHRKLLIVDGRIGFTGGVGIGDEWTGDAQDKDHWRDTHFRVEGPVAAQLQHAFMDNWLKTHAQVLHGDDYFPPLEPCGDCLGQLFQSSPDQGSESVRLMYLLSITAAQESVLLSTAYFVPDELSVRTLVAARERGVRVQVIVPGPEIDYPFVRWASRARWGPLLEAGVEIYEYMPTMYHVKVMVVDGVWVSIGSTNFDNRSFRLNDEANLNAYDAALARHQAEWFERDRARSRRITLEAWRSRPLREKLRDHLVDLAGSQL